MEPLIPQPGLTVCLATACGLWLLVLADFLPKKKSSGSNALLDDSRYALLALTAILASFIPAVALQGRISTALAYGVGFAGLLIYVRFQPKEFSLWKTPAKRLLTIAIASFVSVVYTVLVPSAEYIPLVFAYIVLLLHRRAMHRALAQNLAELEALTHHILATTAELQNYAVFQKAKTEDDFLRKTG
jgi:hypothetical protein